MPSIKRQLLFAFCALCANVLGCDDPSSTRRDVELSDASGELADGDGVDELDAEHPDDTATAELDSADGDAAPDVVVCTSFETQTACEASLPCRWDEPSPGEGACTDEPLTSDCDGLGLAACVAAEPCHWFGVTDPCSCLVCPCDVSICPEGADWQGEQCLSPEGAPLVEYCCSIQSGVCVPDRDCPAYETPKRCEWDPLCDWQYLNDQYMPGECVAAN